MKRKKPPRGPQFYTARHLEKREQPKTQARLTRQPYPNTQEFHEGEWVDAQGRQYRIATHKHPMEWLPGEPIPLPTAEERDRLLAQPRPVFWIKLLRGSGPSAWFQPRDLLLQQTLVLHPAQAGVPPVRVRVQEARRRPPKGRSGGLVVTVL